MRFPGLGDRSPYGFFEKVGPILARKAGPGHAALLILGMIGVVAGIVVPIELNAPYLFVLVLVFLVFLAILIARTPVQSERSGSKRVGPSRAQLANALKKVRELPPEDLK